MNPVVVNCQGLPCPKPIIQLTDMFKKGAPADIEVVVDNRAAVENVTRFLTKRGYAVTCKTEGALWRLCGHTDNVAAATGGEENLNDYACAVPGEEMRTLVMLVAPVLGSGDDELGGKLMKNFLATLPEMGSNLWRIVMLNGGVQLAAEGSPVLEQLQALEKAGVSILVCGTCLEHFGLTAKKQVGETTNMLDIVTSMQLAHKVIRV